MATRAPRPGSSTRAQVVRLVLVLVGLLLGILVLSVIVSQSLRGRPDSSPASPTPAAWSTAATDPSTILAWSLPGAP